MPEDICEILRRRRSTRALDEAALAEVERQAVWVVR